MVGGLLASHAPPPRRYLVALEASYVPPPRRYLVRLEASYAPTPRRYLTGLEATCAPLPRRYPVALEASYVRPPRRYPTGIGVLLVAFLRVVAALRVVAEGPESRVRASELASFGREVPAGSAFSAR